MFGSLKEKLGFGKKRRSIRIRSQGEAVELSKVSDPTFGEVIL